MNSIFLDLGFIQIHWYSVLILLAIYIAYKLVVAESKKMNISITFIDNLCFFVVIFGILGARLYYVLFNLDYYSVNILEIFQIWKGGLAIHGGIIAGLLTIIAYSKKKKVNTMRLTDIIIPGLLIAQAIGRWGNFFNSEAHGPTTTIEFLKSIHLPNFIIEGMNIGGVYYHPTFLYESLWCFLGFIIALLIRRMKYIKIGQLTGFYLIWYGIGRFLIESLRTDSLMLGNLKIAQIVSIIMVISGIIIIIIKGRGSKLDNKYNISEGVYEKKL